MTTEPRRLDGAATRPTVLFINTRPSPVEAEQCFAAAAALRLDVVLLTDTDPPVDLAWITATVRVDTYDLPALVAAATEVAQHRDVRGAVCWGDRDVEGVAAIASALSLPGNTPAAAATARNKGAMREALAIHAPDLAPAFARVWTEHDLHGALEQVPLPAILKPAGASTSKGIFDVTSVQQAHRAFAELQHFTRPEVDPIFRYYPGELVLEARITGREVSVEGICVDGVLVVAAVTAKYVREPFFLEYLQVHPATLTPAAEAAARDAAARAVCAAGLGTTAVHVEMLLDGEAAVLLELNARTGGSYIATHLLAMARGYDFLANTLIACCALGDVAPIPGAFAAAGSWHVLVERSGRLAEVRRVDDALRVPGVVRFVQDVAPGNAVAQPPASYTASTIGSLIARGPDAAAVVSTLERAQQCLDVVLQ